MMVNTNSTFRVLLLTMVNTHCFFRYIPIQYSFGIRYWGSLYCMKYFFMVGLDRLVIFDLMFLGNLSMISGIIIRLEIIGLTIF